MIGRGVKMAGFMKIIILFYFVCFSAVYAETALEDQKKIQKQQMIRWQEELEKINKIRRNENRIMLLVSRILNQSPENVKALNVLGAYYLKTGRTKLADIIFTRALKKDPKNSSVHNNKGLVFLKEGREREAFLAFQKSLRYKRSNYASAANLGSLYLKAYEHGQALDFMARAYRQVRSRPNLAQGSVLDVGNNYAVALSWAGDFNRSRSVFKELVNSYPDSLDLAANYAVLLAKDLRERSPARTALRKMDFLDKTGRYSKKRREIRKYLESKKIKGDNKGR